MKNPVYPISVGLILTAVAANSAIIVEDTFLSGLTPANGEYAADTALVGANPSTPGTSGAWLGNVGATNNVKSVAAGLDYSDPLYIAETGGSAQFAPTGGSGDQGRQGRILSSAVTNASSGDLYMSFLMQTGTNETGAYRAFELHDGGFDDGTHRKFQLGFQSGDFNSTTNYGFRLFNNNSFRSTLGTNDTEVNLFVVKFSLSTDNDGDSITVWHNPDLSTGTDPASGGVSFDTFNLTFDRFTFAKFGDNSADVSWDEVRFGDTFGDVTVVPEPSSMALLGLGGLALLVRRRRIA